MTSKMFASCRVLIEDLYFTYRRADKPALKNINAEVRSGEYTVIMGPGGSGKSSLCYALNGVIPNLLKGTYKGRVIVNGHNVSKCRVAEMARSVGLVLQDFEAQLFSSNVELEMAFGLENLGVDREEIDERISEYLRFIGMEEHRYRQTASLSGGQKQRVAIGSILALEPELLVMDEPTTDLDPVARQHILSLASRTREKGATLVVSDHRSEIALDADVVWLLKDGVLVKTGTPQEVMTDADLLRECSVRPPEILELLKALGYPAKVWTVEEAERVIRSRPPRLRITSETPFYVVRSFPQHSPIVETCGLTHVYENSSSAAIQDINLRISEGEFVGIIGPNGSGKTTLLKHFNQLLKPTSGQVYVDGKPIERYERHETAQIVGYVFQNPDHQIFAPTVEEEVSFSLRQFGVDEGSIRQRSAEALDAVGLQGYEQQDPACLTKGERQRVAVASALVTRPRVLILDEPTTGLDHPCQQRLMRMLLELNQQGHTIIMATHTLWLVAEYAQRVMVLNAGGEIILDGPTRTVFAHEDILADAGIRLPPVVRLSNRLGLEALTIEQMVQEIGFQ